MKRSSFVQKMDDEYSDQELASMCHCDVETCEHIRRELEKTTASKFAAYEAGKEHRPRPYVTPGDIRAYLALNFHGQQKSIRYIKPKVGVEGIVHQSSQVDWNEYHSATLREAQGPPVDSDIFFGELHHA